MSIHFHSLTVREVRRETPDCVSVAFTIPPSLIKHFSFKQGQSLTMRTMLNGEEIRRTYSICASPLDKEWRVAIKKVEGGVFSTFANSILKEGDTLDVMPPVGTFNTELDPINEKHYLAIAAGSGITPVLSLIKTTLATESRSSFTLIFGNRNRQSIIFSEALEGLKNKYMDRFNLIHVLSREKTDTPLHAGRINAEKLDALKNLIDYSHIHDFFICGPEEMIFCAKNYFEKSGIDPKKIHFELFTSPGQSKKSGTAFNKKEAPETASQVLLKIDGRTFEFPIMAGSDASILDAALKAGADLPYACKGGMCCTCKAKLLEGKVEMDVHWGLEEDEIKKGYILTCQSHPKSEKVSIDFDAR
jgi:ring-1,2-phenylacetyl-CoA epoxidase subunit PaaE